MADLLVNEVDYSLWFLYHKSGTKAVIAYQLKPLELEPLLVEDGLHNIFQVDLLLYLV
jgi:hypothetical protein